MELTPKEYGQRAFENGIGCYPILDIEFMRDYIDGVVSNESMDEWIEGWKEAENVERSQSEHSFSYSCC